MSIHSSLRLRLQGLYYNLGCVLQQQGQLGAAADSYHRAVALTAPDAAPNVAPNTVLTAQAKVYNNLGCVLVQQERWQEAIQVYRQAIQLQPEQGILHSNLGRILFRQDPVEAVAAYRRAIQLEPDLAIAHHNLGLALQHQHQHREALHCFQRVIQLEPDHATIHSDCALSWLALGEAEALLESLRLAILPHRDLVEAYCTQTLHPDPGADPGATVDPDAPDALLAAKASCGQFLAALLHQAEPARLRRLLAQTYGNWANVLTAYGGSEQYQRAEQYYQKALRLQPNDLALLLRLSHCLVRQGLAQPERLNSAIFTCSAALRLYPDSAQLYRQLGQALEQQQQFAAAIDCYQNALTLAASQSAVAESGGVMPTLPKLDSLIRGVYDSTQVWATTQQLKSAYIPVQPEDVSTPESAAGAAVNLDPVETGLPHLATVTAEGGRSEDTEVEDTEVGDAEVNDADSYLKLDGSEPDGSETNCAGLNCAGLNCAVCLKRIWNWFSPVHLGSGLHACTGEEQGSPTVPHLERFVARIPQGKAWIVPQRNAWMVCNAVAILTADDWLLTDLCRAYPGKLPSCDDASRQIHPAFTQAERPPLKIIEGRVVVLSSLSGNTYFHWIVDVLPRLELLRLSGVSLDSIDWFLINSNQHSFQRQTLYQLGIPAEKIIASDCFPYLQATELIVPSFAGHFGWLEAWSLSFLRRIFPPTSPQNLPEDGLPAAKVSGQSTAHPPNQTTGQTTARAILSPGLKSAVRSFQANSAPGWRKSFQVGAALPERIYITRSDANHRRVLNEAQVLDQISELGFVSIELEALSFQQQVDLFAQARIILAPHGSGLTNLIFCNPAATVVELVSPHYIRHYYWVISRLLGLKHYFLLGEVLPCYPVRELMYQNPLIEDIWVNLDSLKATLSLVLSPCCSPS